VENSSSDGSRDGGTDMTSNGEMPVRWVVLFTGSTATADYEPTGSAGESATLIDEVARVCVAFHPHNDIRLFPRDRAAVLFWRAQATGDFIVTRVTTAPNPEGTRTALEYVSIVLTPGDLARLHNDPFRVVALGLSDRIRETFLAGGRQALSAAVPATAPAAPAGAAVPLPATDSIATPENARAIEDFCARRAAEGATDAPPTFANWWASRGWIPPGYFDIVLRAAAPQALTLRDGTDAATALASNVKAALPNLSKPDPVASGLIVSVLANADAVTSAIATAAERVNTEGPEEFRERLSEASHKASQVGADLTALGRRLSDAGSIAEGTRLQELAVRYAGLMEEIHKIRHPNPFGNRTNPAPPTGKNATRVMTPTVMGLTTAGLTRTPPPDTNSGRNGLTAPAPVATSSDSAVPARKSGDGSLGKPAIAAGVLVAIAAVFGIWKLTDQHPAGGGGGATGVAVTTPAAVASPTLAPVHSRPAASIKPTTTAGGGVASPPGRLSPQLLVKQYLPAATPLACADARAAGLTAVAAHPGATPSDTDLDRIVMRSLVSAYKESLSPADFQRALGNAQSWHYAQFEHLFPTALPVVRKAAAAGVAEARADAAERARALTAAVPARTPAPEQAPPAEHRTEALRQVRHRVEQAADVSAAPKPRHNRDSSASEPKHAHSASAAPRATTPAASSGGGSSAGSAADSGL
jgi:hypothetical protein